MGFTALVAVLSYFWTKGTDEEHSEGYFLGGRSLTAPVIAGSLLLTNLSTEQIVGLTGQACSEGVVVMAWETLAAISPRRRPGAGAVLGRIDRALTRLIERAVRDVRLGRADRLRDDELGRRGIVCEDILRRVYADVFAR